MIEVGTITLNLAELIELEIEVGALPQLAALPIDTICHILEGGRDVIGTTGEVAIAEHGNIGEEVVSGIYGRKIESTVDAVDDLAHGRTDFRSAVEYVAEKTYDGKELGKDVIKGSIKGVTSAATEHAAKNINVGGQSSYDSTVKNSNAYVEIASKGVKGSVDKTITGVSDRYINQRIDGYAV